MAKKLYILTGQAKPNYLWWANRENELFKVLKDHGSSFTVMDHGQTRYFYEWEVVAGHITLIEAENEKDVVAHLDAKRQAVLKHKAEVIQDLEEATTRQLEAIYKDRQYLLEQYRGLTS